MPFVITGCRSVQAHELCMVSVGVVTDLCAAVGKQVQPYCDLIVNALTDCLSDASAHRDTKPVVCSCFGEVAMAIGAQFEPYLAVIALLLMQASQTPAHPDDPVLTDFINKLRLSILDAYSGIILGLSDGNALHLFMPHIPNVLSFLQVLSSPASLRDVLCLEKAVALLGDIAQQMGTDVRIKQELSQPYVAQLIQDAGTCGDTSAMEVAMWTQGVVREVLTVTAAAAP
jgi:importin subunit beta-1